MGNHLRVQPGQPLHDIANVTISDHDHDLGMVQHGYYYNELGCNVKKRLYDIMPTYQIKSPPSSWRLEHVSHDRPKMLKRSFDSSTKS